MDIMLWEPNGERVGGAAVDQTGDEQRAFYKQSSLRGPRNSETILLFPSCVPCDDRELFYNSRTTQLPMSPHRVLV